jgi:hypothetical protein
MARKYFTTYDDPRPALITVVCLIGFAITFAELLAIFFASSQSFELVLTYGKSFPIVTVIVDIVTLIAYVGIWRMRMWGVLLFGITAVAVAIYGFTIGVEYWWNYAPALIILLICVLHLKRMK